MALLLNTYIALLSVNLSCGKPIYCISKILGSNTIKSSPKAVNCGLEVPKTQFFLNDF